VNEHPPHDPVGAWRALGSLVRLGDDDIFVIDRPGPADSSLAPVLVLHGFPSCSYDWCGVVDRLAATRRVVLFDYAGFGLSSKPDRRYSMRGYADTAQAVAGTLRLEQVALLTHDLGNSVGGELLARSLEGTLPFEIVSRVMTNGSIYMSLVHLSDGQQFLLALDDAPIDLGDTAEQAFKNGLAYAFSVAHPASAAELDAQWAFVHHQEGERLLARTIRYIEDRRVEEGRFTGAIERHPSPLGLVWGDEDPIAVAAMAIRLVERRPGTPQVLLEGVGHYPMIEAPDQFTDTVLSLFAEIELAS